MSICGYLGWFLAALDVSMDCGKGNTRNQDEAGDGCCQLAPGSNRMGCCFLSSILGCFFLKLMLLAEFLPFLIYINNRRGVFKCRIHFHHRLIEFSAFLILQYFTNLLIRIFLLMVDDIQYFFKLVHNKSAKG